MPIIGSQGAWQGSDRLDDDARAAIQRAEALGATRGRRQVPPDVLLTVLLDDPTGTPATVLRALGVDVDAALQAVDALVKPKGSPLEGRSALDNDAREAVVLGVNEARRSGAAQVGTGHLLLGIVESRTPGARVLLKAGAALTPLRDLLQTLGQEEAKNVGAAADAFIPEFTAFLSRVGGGGHCPRCEAPLHESFAHCWRCGLRFH